MSIQEYTYLEVDQLMVQAELVQRLSIVSIELVLRQITQKSKSLGVQVNQLHFNCNCYSLSMPFAFRISRYAKFNYTNIKYLIISIFHNFETSVSTVVFPILLLFLLKLIVYYLGNDIPFSVRVYFTASLKFFFFLF